MRDSAPSPVDDDDPFAFDPVPSASNRHDGWTPERQRLFIQAMRRIGMVTAAAKAVGMSPKSAYNLLERAGPDSDFARVWRWALVDGRGNASATAIERALHGVEVPYFYGGIERGTRRVYDNRLLMTALRAADRAADRGQRRR